MLKMCKKDLSAFNDTTFFSASSDSYSGFQQEDSEKENDEAEMMQLTLTEDLEEFEYLRLISSFTNSEH